MTRFRNLFQVWWLQVVCGIVGAGFVAVLYSYFVKSKINYEYIILAEGLGYGLAALFIVLKKQFRIPFDLRLGFVLMLGAFFSLFLPFSPVILLFVYTLIRISGVIMFFVPYNILFFRSTEKNKRLHKMTVMWSIGSVVGIVAPILSGYIFFKFGLALFISTAVGTLLLALLLTFFLKYEVHSYSFNDILTQLKGLRTITMLDGGTENISGVLITLHLLTFIRGEFDFGKLLSIIALISVVFSFRVAKFSDRYNRRVEFIWPLSFLLAVIMVFFYFVQNFWAVVLLVILFKFVTTLLNPIRSNIILDKVENTALTWIARDVYLNIGRAIILFCVSAILYVGFFKEAFIFVGSLFLIFPFLIYKKKIYSSVKV